MEQITFTTQIPNNFIDIHMLSAKPVFSVLYIYAFRQYNKGVEFICNDTTADLFDVTIKDIERAWEYWQEAGLIKILSKEGNTIKLAFLDVRNLGLEKKQEIAAVPVIQEVSDFSSHYTLEEIEKRLLDSEIARLFYGVHEILGKPLTDVERRMYLSFCDDLGLCVDVICVMLEYCVEKNKTHSNYLRAVAHDWSERGISTVDEAEEYINLFNNEYREILRYLGVSGRDPIEKEIMYMNKWLKEDNFSLPMLKLACERTIMNKATANFAYTDGILRKWKKDKIHTTGQVAELEKSYYDNIKATRQQSAKSKSDKTSQTQSLKKGKFQNYKGREWDYDKLAKMEQEYLSKKIAD